MCSALERGSEVGFPCRGVIGRRPDAVGDSESEYRLPRRAETTDES